MMGSRDELSSSMSEFSPLVTDQPTTRRRRKSGPQLDKYLEAISGVLLSNQDPTTGLFPPSRGHPHAWVRDNCYSVMCVWALAVAYRKRADSAEDFAKVFELEHCVVKAMRGLLRCMMKQIDKVEQFKASEAPGDCLHAKYSVTSGEPVVGDFEWGHLQIDATSLFLLTLAQMTASGIQIIFSLDEVAFIQNLIFYIEAAYRIPDFGIWERGDKTNHGVTELNASSIGMAKAALEALNELDLFGSKGGKASIVYSLMDEAHQCNAMLLSMLPRESYSKEVDAALLTVIGFPAFAVSEREIVAETCARIENKLNGRYGYKRFLRDGYKNAKEDPNRLYYEKWELTHFENTECEWPVFFAYRSLTSFFTDDIQQARLFLNKLEGSIVLHGSGRIKVVPELFSVPASLLDAERQQPGSQKRVPAGKTPHLWGFSMFLICELLDNGYISPGELDPLNRRLASMPKPDLVVQVVVLAENQKIQEKLAEYGFEVESFADCEQIRVLPAKSLSFAYGQLGKNAELGLSGRPNSDVGLLSTSKLYNVDGQVFAFMPQHLDFEGFYLALDEPLLMDMFKADVESLRYSWRMLGRPVVILPVREVMIKPDQSGQSSLHPSLLATMRKLQSGYIHGTRVTVGNLSDFLSTSCVTKMHFLTDTPAKKALWEKHWSKVVAAQMPERRLCTSSVCYVAPKAREPTPMNKLGRGSSSALIGGSQPPSDQLQARRRSSARYQGMIRKTMSIQVDSFPKLQPATTSTFYVDDDDEDLVDNVFQRADALQGTEKVPMQPAKPRPISRLKSGTAVASTGNMFSLSSSSGTKLSEKADERNLCSPYNSPSSFSLVSASRTTQQRFEQVEMDDLIYLLYESEDIVEQADILHYIYGQKGIDYQLDWPNEAQAVSVKELLIELYQKASNVRQWMLVRHIAGMLRRRVDHLAKVVADLLVHQKQLSIGLPPHHELLIDRPLPPEELAAKIYQAYGTDLSTAMLTQELLVYLAMFIRTEPKLFNGIFQLRVGLIIQVMASELSIALSCSGVEGADHLLNLSPHETKTLLHHIFSGKEFGVKKELSRHMNSPGTSISIKPLFNKGTAGAELRDQLDDDSDTGVTQSRQGQWLRRRRLDGSLNRVPVHFYKHIWRFLELCDGINIHGTLLSSDLIKEMTEDELKFILSVEEILNKIWQPDFKQLIIEVLALLSGFIDVIFSGLSLSERKKRFHCGIIMVDDIVYEANDQFLDEQLKNDGDAVLCCAEPNRRRGPARHDMTLACNGNMGICALFYDSAPSGAYGTLCFLLKAMAKLIPLPVMADGDTLNCSGCSP